MAQQLKRKKKSASVLKRQRQTITKQKRNNSVKSTFRSEFKKILKFYKDGVGASKSFTIEKSHKLIDKAKTNGVLTKNAASRYKSNISKLSADKQNKTTDKSTV